jgi:hypothetical protein
MLTADAIDVAEGLRHLERMSALASVQRLREPRAHPYFWTALDPHRKMGGDNPQALPRRRSTAPRLRGPWHAARLGGSPPSCNAPAARLAGAPAFGGVVPPDRHLDADGRFSSSSPPRAGPNWVRTDEYSSTLLVRQFFGAPDDVELMELEIENVTRGTGCRRCSPSTAHRRPRSGDSHVRVAPPLFQGEMREGGLDQRLHDRCRCADERRGRSAGRQRVVARWRIEPDEALIVTVVPPHPCAYWDVQVGNIWYESFDYQHVFSGFTCENAHLDDDGSVTFVVADRDPGTANWLEAAGHREGHIALRDQL